MKFNAEILHQNKNSEMTYIKYFYDVDQNQR